MNFKVINFVANGAIGKTNLGSLIFGCFSKYDIRLLLTQLVLQIFHQSCVVFLVLQSNAQLCTIAVRFSLSMSTQPKTRIVAFS